MYRFKKYLVFGVTSVVITGCAYMQTESEKATYHESSFNDLNRAPASLTPPTPSSDEKSTLDPFYLRTQADYYFSIGETYSLSGDHTKAVEAFKSTLIYDQNSPTVRMRLSAEYLKLGMVSESLAQAEEAVSMDPKNVDARLLLGGLQSSLKFYSKALEQYQTVLKLEPKNTEAPLYIGAVYSEQQQYDKAVKYFESLLKNPEYTTPYLAHYYVGRVRAEQVGKKYDVAAEEAYKRSLKAKPEFVDAVLALGNLYGKRKDKNSMISLYKNFQKENGPNNRISEILAQSYIEQESYDLAFEQLEYMESSGEDVLNVKMKLALVLIEQRQYDKATAKLEDILREVPDSDKVRFYLAATYEESGKFEKAVVNYRKIPATSQFFSDAIVHTSYILKNKGDFETALTVLESALKEKSEAPQLYAMYASLLDEKGDYKKALDVLSNALKKFSDNTQLRFYYGTINDRVGNKETVVNEMKKVLEIDPNHVQGMNYLAFTWAEQGINLPEAEKLARKALSLEPQDGYILDTLGWILYKQGKFIESVKMLEAAVKYQAAVSIIAEHLGDAYYKQSLIDKAKKMYKRAADLETDLQKQKEIHDKITAIEKQETGVRMPASVPTSSKSAGK